MSKILIILVIFFFFLPLKALAATPTPTPPGLPGDLNGNRRVNIFDLNILVGDYGKSGVAADLNGDGVVNASDYALLLGYMGAVVPPAPTASPTSTPVPTVAPTATPTPTPTPTSVPVCVSWTGMYINSCNLATSFTNNDPVCSTNNLSVTLHVSGSNSPDKMKFYNVPAFSTTCGSLTGTEPGWSTEEAFSSLKSNWDLLSLSGDKKVCTILHNSKGWGGACGGGIHFVPAAAYPNCKSLVGPATLNVGQVGTFSAFYEDYGGPLTKAGLVVASQANCSSIVYAPTAFTGTNKSYSWNWTPAAAGTYTVYCRGWNDGIAECRGTCVDAPPRYQCLGPAASMTVTVH